jgi:hypothetical protein
MSELLQIACEVLFGLSPWGARPQSEQLKEPFGWQTVAVWLFIAGVAAAVIFVMVIR